MGIMIEFKELKINREGNTLVIDVEVLDLPYFNDICIQSIDIDSQDTFVGTGISTTPIYSRAELEGSTTKAQRLELTEQDLNVSLTGNMFFVYVTVKGTPAQGTPQDMVVPTTLGVVVYLYPFYTKTIGYFREIQAESCTECLAAKGLTDMILKLHALELSIKLGHYTQAISYWNKFFKNITVNV